MDLLNDKIVLTHQELINVYRFAARWPDIRRSSLVRRGTALRLGLTHKNHEMRMEMEVSNDE